MSKSRHLFFVTLFSIAVIAMSFGGCGEDTPQGPVDDGGGDDDCVETGPDTIAPASVTSLLAKNPLPSKVTLFWFAPGDNDMKCQASRYDVRWSRSFIAEDDWDSATPIADVDPPKPANQPEQLVVRGLPSETAVYFALKTFDEASNESELSNIVTETTLAETFPPSDVGDLIAETVSETQVLLIWTAPGDDGLIGQASSYDIRYDFARGLEDFRYSAADRADGEPSPRPFGERDSCYVSGLDPNENYYFALKTADEGENWSHVSNVAASLSWSNNVFASPPTVYINETRRVEILFRTLDTTNRASVVVTHYEWWPVSDWIVLRHLVSDSFVAGVHRVIWDTKNDAGELPDALWGQCYVRVNWDGVPIDSSGVRVQESR